MLRSLDLPMPFPPSAQRFDWLYERHFAELVRLAATVLGDAPAAEDIAQDTFIKLNQSDLDGRNDGELAAWLRRVCVNASLNELRSRRRRTDRHEQLTRASDAVAPTRERPDTQALLREEQARVRAALDSIPEQLRACLVLRHSGYSYAEIAEALGIAIGSVGVYLARGERAFRSLYEETQS